MTKQELIQKWEREIRKHGFSCNPPVQDEFYNKCLKNLKKCKRGDWILIYCCRNPIPVKFSCISNNKSLPNVFFLHTFGDYAHSYIWTFIRKLTESEMYDWRKSYEQELNFYNNKESTR